MNIDTSIYEKENYFEVGIEELNALKKEKIKFIIQNSGCYSPSAGDILYLIYII